MLMLRAVCSVLKQERAGAGAGSAVDVLVDDDPGGGIGDDLGAFGDLAISSKTSASFVSSSLTTGISLLSPSDKSTVDMVGNVDVDYATGSFCSSCAIPSPI